ncbi:MAG: 4-hydroxythreonine-4-phosphate dehydrogenase PdxA [Balneolales bacterium]|nr:4-hydroxythreonine-4-phosphate dehydrogenase PdxA [Balneolales bacterium]
MIKTGSIQIAISIGDFNGIGPEVIIKSLSGVDLSTSTPVILSPVSIIEHYNSLVDSPIEFHIAEDGIHQNAINVLPIEVDEFDIEPGVQSPSGGRVAMNSIESSLQLLQNGTAHAMVTAPISKEAVNLAGYHIPGHTEFLAEKTGVEEVLMMLINDSLRVALVTTHLPISQVASNITEGAILQKLQLLHHSLKYDFGIESPKIAVFGLNPHAGDGGIIGSEETEIIEPALKRAQDSGMNVHGPFPADGFFGHQSHRNFDAILAMYHDQGLAPFKLLSFGNGINYSAGLPIIRTSPDHGTAFDIAGKNLANPSSFTLAYHQAVRLAETKYGLQ